MKENINFYYNLNVDEVEDWGETFRFKIGEDIFYFVPLKRIDNEINDILHICNELKGRNIDVHDIILNKYGKVITTVYNAKFILLKPNKDIYEEYDLNNMLKFNQKLILNMSKSKLYRNSWAMLWGEKLDYFEYQIHELGKDKTLILDTFSYYIGLGENAISYVNSTTSKYKFSDIDKIVLSHRRINYPNYKLNYFNPLSFIFDLEVRDIASFIKSAFFAGEDALSYLEEALRFKKYSIYSLQMLYARILYPTYYFDIYDKIMNKEESEEELITIIEKCDDFEVFLKKCFLVINKYAPIERIEWILKKEL